MLLLSFPGLSGFRIEFPLSGDAPNASSFPQRTPGTRFLRCLVKWKTKRFALKSDLPQQKQLSSAPRTCFPVLLETLVAKLFAKLSEDVPSLPFKNTQKN